MREQRGACAAGVHAGCECARTGRGGLGNEVGLAVSAGRPPVVQSQTPGEALEAGRPPLGRQAGRHPGPQDAGSKTPGWSQEPESVHQLHLMQKGKVSSPSTGLLKQPSLSLIKEC